MLDLTFGEQVKIILSRKDMTIKELAEQIEERTGKKMSRQNLTQRLGRDNFQEQDMRMIAEILECPFQLSILADLEIVEKASKIEVVTPSGRELDKLAKAKERKEKKRKEAEREKLADAMDMIPSEIEGESEQKQMTLGDYMDIHEELKRQETQQIQPIEEPMEKPATEVTAPVSEMKTQMIPQIEEEEEIQKDESIDVEEALREIEALQAEEREQRNMETMKMPDLEEIRREEKRTGGWRGMFQRKKKEAKQVNNRAVVDDELEYLDLDALEDEEDLEYGDINPKTGHEYETNSVRMHPRRIGYVQVYDRKDHTWTEMTEWAFLGYQERKKALLGKDYEEPIYID